MDLRLKDLGETKAKNLIRELLSCRTMDSAELEDDCAVIDIGSEFLILTSDMISEKTHIPKGATYRQIGWHVAAINLSDIAAMGGRPLGMVVAMGLPDSLEEESLKEIIEGMEACTSRYDACILGGDTKEAPTLTLTGSALGRVEKDSILLRRGAKPGDVVAVTGELGRAAAGFYAMENEIEDPDSVKRILEVVPRIHEGRALAFSQVVTSAMDISDGLASSVHQLSRLNGVGFELQMDNIPVAQAGKEIAGKLNILVEDVAIYFGGDYELLVTVNADGFPGAQKALSRFGCPLTSIGRVTENEINTLIKDGATTSLEDRGYEHFRWKE